MARKYDDSSIKAITDDRDRMRKRPTLYIPSTGAKGALHIAFEIIDNSIDELSVENPVGDTVTITFDQKTREFTIADDGSGIPQKSLLNVCTVINSSGKFDNGEDSAYQWSGGTNGIGLKLAVFLSEYCIVTSTRGGKAVTAKFVDGRLDSMTEEKTKPKSHGTVVQYKSSQKFVDIKGVTIDDIIMRCQEKAALFPKIHIVLNIVENGKEVCSYHYYDKDISDAVMDMEPTTSIIHVEDDRKVSVLTNLSSEKTKDVRVITEASFALKEEALDGEKDQYIISYCNTIKTYSGGTNVEGLKLGLVQFFNKNVIPNLSKKDQDLRIVPTDITAGLCGVVVAKIYEPEFEGQHKDRINNPAIKFAVRDAVCEALERQKSNVINPMIDFVKRVARGRIASKKVRRKDVTSAFSKDRNKKFQDMVWNKDTVFPTLIIVEGDSAADLAASARDYHNQAIYGVMRPKNSIDTDSNKFDRQAVSTFNDVLDYINVQTGDKCNPDDCRVRRILMMTDGDVDGDAISDTMVSMFGKHCKPLVDAGMIGRILPPFYSFKIGKKTKYVRSQREFFDLVMKDFTKHVTVGRGKHEFTKKELFEFIDLNFEYTEKLNKLYKRTYCPPRFLEFVAAHYLGGLQDQTLSYWKKVLKSYDDLKIWEEEGCLVIDGETPEGYIHLALDKSFDHNVWKFKSYQSQNQYIDGYTINGKNGKTVFDIMEKFDVYKPDGIKRFKGLGELDPDEMWDLCLNPETREVLIFKFDDVETDMEKIHVIMSTKQKYTKARSEILRNMVAEDIDIDT